VVVQLSWEWVICGVCDVIVGHVDDLIRGDAVLFHNLVSVCSVSLVTVVPVSVGTSDEDSPVIGFVSGSKSSKSRSGEEGLHRVYNLINIILVP